MKFSWLRGQAASRATEATQFLGKILRTITRMAGRGELEAPQVPSKCRSVGALELII